MTWHGTLNGYTNQGCRCDQCRTAQREYQKERREAAGDLSFRAPRTPPQLFRDGKLCCLICSEPYSDHPIAKSCYREAAKI